MNENEMKENSSLFSRNAPRMEGMDQHLACLICAMRLHPSSPFDHGLSTAERRGIPRPCVRLIGSRGLGRRSAQRQLASTSTHPAPMMCRSELNRKVP